MFEKNGKYNRLLKGLELGCQDIRYTLNVGKIDCDVLKVVETSD